MRFVNIHLQVLLSLHYLIHLHISSPNRQTEALGNMQRDKNCHIVISQFNIGNNPSNEIDIHSQVLHWEGANVTGAIVLGAFVQVAEVPRYSAQAESSVTVS